MKFIDDLPPGQQAVLDALSSLTRSLGYPAPTEAIAKELGLTTQGVRDHMHSLVRKGHVEQCKPVVPGPWRITRKGRRRVPGDPADGQE